MDHRGHRGDGEEGAEKERECFDPEKMVVAAMAVEFDLRRIQYVRQHPVQVQYKQRPVGTGKIDFTVEHRVIVELKAVAALHDIHTAQAIAYLKATGLRVALLINFNVLLLKDGIKRITL